MWTVHTPAPSLPEVSWPLLSTDFPMLPLAKGHLLGARSSGRLPQLAISRRIPPSCPCPQLLPCLQALDVTSCLLPSVCPLPRDVSPTRPWSVSHFPGCVGWSLRLPPSPHSGNEASQQARVITAVPLAHSDMAAKAEILGPQPSSPVPFLHMPSPGLEGARVPGSHVTPPTQGSRLPVGLHRVSCSLVPFRCHVAPRRAAGRGADREDGLGPRRPVLILGAGAGGGRMAGGASGQQPSSLGASVGSSVARSVTTRQSPERETARTGGFPKVEPGAAELGCPPPTMWTEGSTGSQDQASERFSDAPSRGASCTVCWAHWR